MGAIIAAHETCRSRCDVLAIMRWGDTDAGTRSTICGCERRVVSCRTGAGVTPIRCLFPGGFDTSDFGGRAHPFAAAGACAYVGDESGPVLRQRKCGKCFGSSSGSP